MKYNQPYGNNDPNAAYVDHDTANAIAGSVPPAAAIEAPQREIVAVIAAAGLTPSNGDYGQLLKALQYFFRQPRLYPDVLTANGRMGIFSPSTGVVRVPANVEWIMTGHMHYKSVQQDLATAASKSYHLRWDADNGFRLRELNSAYLGGLQETDNSFDTKYDDMLVAKVDANGSNVVTVTDLSNKSRLAFADIVTGTDIHHSGTNGANFAVQKSLNWSRTPDDYTLSIAYANCAAPPTASDINFTASNADPDAMVSAATVIPVTRYGLDGRALWDGATAAKFQFSARG